MNVKITYLGHSCFKIEGSAGSIVCDPYDGTLGYGDLKVSANAAVKSHDHYDHGYMEAVNIVEPEKNKFKITAFGSYHDSEQGAKRGKNIIHVIETDGIRICHLGDLGHMLSDDAVETLGHIDVLLPPVGGNYTITGEQAAELCAKIAPTYIIPMHYKVPCAKIEISDEREFLKKISSGYSVSYYPSDCLEIAPDLGRGVYVLMYKPV